MRKSNLNNQYSKNARRMRANRAHDRKNKFQQETQLNKSEQQKFADKSLENSVMNVYDKIY